MLAAPRGAAAEWHITPMLGVTFAGKTTIFDPQLAADKPHKGIGGAVTLLGAGVLGAETVIVFTPGFFNTQLTPLTPNTSPVPVTSSRTLTVMGNVVLTTPRRWTEYGLRPFVSGGFGWLRATQNHSTQTNAVDLAPLVHPNMAGFDLGGGAVGFLTKRTGVRFDLRYYRSIHGSDPSDGSPLAGARLRFMTASVGVVIRR